MKKKLLSFLLAVAMMCSMVPTAFAASAEAIDAANALHEQGLFNGVGTNADGTPNFDLDRTPTRHEAVTMLVAMLGKSSEAQAGNWTTPFTDVADWAKPFVGYAYTNGLTSGTSATTYGGNQPVSATQYLTFVLTALGYKSGTDFQWDKAWELSDKLGITNGQYNATSAFTRGDVAIISYDSLSVKMKNSEQILKETIVFEGEKDFAWSIPADATLYIEFDNFYSYKDGWDCGTILDGASVRVVYYEPNSTEAKTLKNEDVSWSYGNPEMLEIRDNKIVGKKIGDTSLTATLPDGSTITIFGHLASVSEDSDFNEYYKKFCKAFALQDTNTHVYSTVYTGYLSRAAFVEDFDFGSSMWTKAAQKYGAEKVVTQDKYASTIGFYLPIEGSYRKKVYLGSVTLRDGKYSYYWRSADLIKDENYFDY